MFTVSSPFERLHSQPFLFPSWVFVTSLVLHILPYLCFVVIFSLCYFSSILCQPCFFLVYCCLFCVLYTVFYRTYILQSFIMCFNFLHSTPTFFLFGFLSSHFFFSFFFLFYLTELMFCSHLQSVCYSPPPQPSFTAASFVSFCFIQTKTSLSFLICVNLLDAQLSLHLLVLQSFLCFSILQYQYFVVFAIHVNLLHSTPSSYLCDLFFPFYFFFLLSYLGNSLHSFFVVQVGGIKW